MDRRIVAVAIVLILAGSVALGPTTQAPPGDWDERT
ncbi:hypothetical protein HCTV-16_gp143 [Haloarcula virus HCTV-16]|nr:hypothetical protein HCTV-16_gp143 [Haloarcula virus HCTV-16]